VCSQRRKSRSSRRPPVPTSARNRGKKSIFPNRPFPWSAHGFTLQWIILESSLAPGSSFSVPAIIQLGLRPEVLRRNAVRIAGLPSSQEHLIILDR
jgi:hypothetical protein